MRENYMGAKKTLIIWMTSLCTVFGTAAVYPQPDKLQFNDTMTSITTAAGRELPQTPEEKRVEFKPGVEEGLRSAAVKMVWKLGINFHFELAMQITKMENILYYGLPIPVWNRIITALNDEQKRAEILKALKKVVEDVIGDDDALAKKNRDLIDGWEKKPLGFAKFLGDAVDMDFINPPKTTPTQQNQPQK